MTTRQTKAQRESLTPARHFNGGHSTDGADPLEVEALARRILRPLRTEAKLHGYALAVHGSLQRDIDLIAAPWTAEAATPETLVKGLKSVLRHLYPVELEVGPNLEHPKPHGRLCWSFWIRPWTYIDLSVMPLLPPQPSQSEGE
jgi:hypothetical protein